VSVATSKFGYYETFAPDMAIKMELRQNKETNTPEYWIHLRDGVFYKPLRQKDFADDIKLSPHFLKKHQVTAHDFKFYLDAVMNPSVQEPGAVSLRSYLSDIEELKVIDDLTFTVRWKVEPFKEKDGTVVMRPKYIAKLWTGALQPLATFVYQYFPDGTKIAEGDEKNENFYRKNAIWAQNFSRHFAKNIIVSCGPWIFDGFSDRQIQFKRNPNFYNPLAALVAVKVFEFKQSSENIWQDFKSDNLDSYGIQPDQLVELEKFLKSDLYAKQLAKGDGIERLDYVARRYVNIQWNLERPFFRSKRVRQALTMAIDRERIIKQNMNGMGVEITGPFFKYSKANDNQIKPYPFDPHKARLLLEEEGWYDSDGDGIIDKEIDGKRVPFRFYLTYYVKNALGKAISEYIATALKEVGIDCRLNGVDIADLSAAFDDKNFDALFFIWGYGSSPEDPEQLWSSSLAKVKGSSNAIGFQNKEADEIIKKLKMEYDEEERIKLYHRFHAIIYEEAPYTFLFIPKVSLLSRQYLQNVFIPADRQDILPEANVQEPDISIFWIKKPDV
ncbi:MAG TPA: ABC transporter substrate-binding protein, partial [Parachlamydiaceae bacterium]|nr:ABC transporter substrate-binding protein [Parachlamydiaceae bacterium]